MTTPDRTVVRISRRHTDEDIEGFVQAVGARWTLVALLTNRIELDGYVAVRNKHIVSATARDDIQSFVRRALELTGTWPPTPPSTQVDLDDDVALVRSAATVADAVILYIEREDPDVCFVGVPIGYTGRSVGLREIRHTGDWDPEPSTWKTKRITRLDFGDRYSTLLLAVATERDGSGTADD